MSPKRVFPVMPDFCHLAYMVLIDRQSQSRALRNFHVAIFIFKNILVDNVIQQVTSLVIVYPETLFLDKGIVASGVHLKAGGQGYRPQRAMRRNSHVKRDRKST